MKAVKQIKIDKNMKVKDLVKEMNDAGVMGAGRIGKAAEILKEMINDKECKIFFGLAGAMIPGGMREIIIDMLEEGFIDVFVTTGANLTHDLFEAFGFKHYQNINLDDRELNKRKINRIYDCLLKNEVYEKLEDFFNENFDKLKDIKSGKEFLWKLGELINKRSILYSCYKKKIPIFCPAISDSGIGMMIWNNLMKNKDIKLNIFEDLKEILDIAWTTKKVGVFYIGGGVPKNYIQQAMQFSPKGANYGIQIKMDRAEIGGSSGAELKEGISWGKLNKNAKFVDVICDATIALPLIYASVK